MHCYSILKTKWLHIIMPACILLCFSLRANAQSFDLQENRKHVNIPFRLVRNMIIIQLNINNKGPFNFIVDTGVGLMVITDPSLIDSINIISKRTVKIPGLGEGKDAEAYITPEIEVQMPGLTSHNIVAAILKKDHFNLSSYAGMPIHGLLGYEFFNNLAIRVNFNDSTLNICRPADLHPFRKADRIPITIQERKPYLYATITYPNGKKTNSKLIIDLGAGHPVSIENMIQTDGMPKKYVAANLGVGLNGPIDGFLSRINELQLGNYKVKNVLASFPDNTKEKIITAVPRDGNLGMGILKKFRVIFDYPDSAIYIKRGMLFNEPFEHDMSGLEYYASEDFKHVVISRVEPGSPADEAGLQKDDEIVSVNLRPVTKMTLEDIDTLFKSKDDRAVLLEIFRDKKYDNVIIRLRRRI